MRLLCNCCQIVAIQLLFLIKFILTMNREQLEALHKLRPVVETILPHDYMKEDIFLLRFLNLVNLDVQRASEMIKNNMDWRKENAIDEILDEVNPLDKELPYTFGVDRLGRPAILIKAGETDLRKAVIMGKREQAFRSGLKLAETMATRVRQLNASQVVAIIDLSGFSYRRHACRECVAFGQQMGETIEANYPGLAAAIFFINTPRVFEVVLNVIKSVLSRSSRSALHVYGFDRAEWSKALLNWVSPENLHVMFGTNFNVIPSHNEIIHDDLEKSSKKRTVSMTHNNMLVQYSSSNLSFSKAKIQFLFILLQIPLYYGWP